MGVLTTGQTVPNGSQGRFWTVFRSDRNIPSLNSGCNNDYDDDDALRATRSERKWLNRSFGFGNQRRKCVCRLMK